MLGIAGSRVSFDTIELCGTWFKFTVSCTLVDAFCGSIPLLWRIDLSVCVNALRLARYAACLFLANVLRLELGNVLYCRGLPWFLVHESVSAVSYFVLFLWIVHQEHFAPRMFSHVRPGSALWMRCFPTLLRCISGL
jgi:hypothetical protein